MPSCGATEVCIEDNTWPQSVSVCHGSPTPLHSLCGSNAIITPHYGQQRWRERYVQSERYRERRGVNVMRDGGGGTDRLNGGMSEGENAGVCQK